MRRHLGRPPAVYAAWTSNIYPCNWRADTAAADIRCCCSLRTLLGFLVTFWGLQLRISRHAMLSGPGLQHTTAHTAAAAAATFRQAAQHGNTTGQAAPPEHTATCVKHVSTTRPTDECSSTAPKLEPWPTGTATLPGWLGQLPVGYTQPGSMQGILDRLQGRKLADTLAGWGVRQNTPSCENQA